MKNARANEPLIRYHPALWFQWGALILLGLTLFSTLVYWLLGRYAGRADWTPLNCLFMVVITLTTVGYGDWLNIKGFAPAQLYTMFLAMVGVGVPAFVISNLTAWIVEGLFSDVFRRRRMEKRIAKLQDHFIVCGAGHTGFHCIEELYRTGRPFVAIDHDEAPLAQLIRELGDFPYLVGDADNDEVLKSARVERAAGLIACLTGDKDNLYVTLSARRLNPKLHIVSKAIDDVAAPKLRSAGADSTVNPTAIGGLRLVSELVRPTVVTFLDAMLRDPSQAYRFEELTVAPGSEVENKILADANLRRAGDVLVVAARPPGAELFAYNPSADFPLQAGCTIVVLGRMQDLKQLRPSFASRRNKARAPE